MSFFFSSFLSLLHIENQNKKNGKGSKEKGKEGAQVFGFFFLYGPPTRIDPHCRSDRIPLSIRSSRDVEALLEDE